MTAKDPRPKIVKLLEEFPALEDSLRDALAVACTELGCSKGKKTDITCKFCGALLPTLNSLIEDWAARALEKMAHSQPGAAGIYEQCLSELKEVMRFL